MSSALDEIYERSETTAKKPRKIVKKTTEQQNNEFEAKLDTLVDDLASTLKIKVKKLVHTGPGKPKKVKDPDEPTRAQSAYMFWLNANRQNYRYDSDGNKLPENQVVKAAAAVWNTISEDEKAPFVDQAKKSFNEWKTEKEEYNLTHGPKKVAKPKTTRKKVVSDNQQSDEPTTSKKKVSVTSDEGSLEEPRGLKKTLTPMDETSDQEDKYEPVETIRKSLNYRRSKNN